MILAAAIKPKLVEEKVLPPEAAEYPREYLPGDDYVVPYDLTCGDLTRRFRPGNDATRMYQVWACSLVQGHVGFHVGFMDDHINNPIDSTSYYWSDGQNGLIAEGRPRGRILSYSYPNRD